MMQLSPANRQRLLCSAAGIAPLLVVAAAIFLRDQGPTSVLANSPAAEPPNAAQLELPRDWFLRSVPTVPDDLGSPFYSPPAQVEAAIAVGNPEAPAAPDPIEAAVRRLQLSSVAVDALNAPFAFIDGRRMRIGDALAPGVVVENIDITARTVHVSLPSGKTVVIAMNAR